MGLAKYIHQWLILLEYDSGWFRSVNLSTSYVKIYRYYGTKYQTVL